MLQPAAEAVLDERDKTGVRYRPLTTSIYQSKKETTDCTSFSVSSCSSAHPTSVLRGKYEVTVGSRSTGRDNTSQSAFQPRSDSMFGSCTKFDTAAANPTWRENSSMLARLILRPLQLPSFRHD
jgi:hypothetical protein